jgi:hypothetical protein
MLATANSIFGTTKRRKGCGVEKMSAEGKKKRGESGMSNAKNIPFRYGGNPCDYSITPRFCVSRYGNGSLLVRAMILGDMLAHRFGCSISTTQALRTEDAMRRCTHPELILR